MSKKIGRPSTAAKKLKNGYYLEIFLKDAVRPIRILRETEDGLNFPVLNVGKHVDDWKNTKHKNKVNANQAGPEHRAFFDYKGLVVNK